MDLAGKRVAILATDLFEESELIQPRESLEKAGATVEVLAPHDGHLQAMRHDQKTGTVPVDVTLAEASPADYDAVMLPGGAMNADHLRADQAAQQFVRAMDQAGKPLAVICHGPWLLVSAGLVTGRRLTSYHTIADDLRNAGATWVDEPVVTDRNWVSSRQPDDLPAFTTAMCRLFAGKTT